MRNNLKIRKVIYEQGDIPIKIMKENINSGLKFYDIKYHLKLKTFF